jgi:hypothetical protein
MEVNEMFGNRLLTLTFASGLLGGALLVLASFFLTPGKLVLVPYALLVLGTLLIVRAERISSFRARFAVGLGVFVLGSLALYVAIVVAVGPSFGILGHLWRLAVVLALGVAVNLPLARLAEPVPSGAA